MYKLLFTLIIVLPLSIFGQTKISGSKYNYSFVVPDGWHSKDKIYSPDVDTKIIDGKGNSFIVTVVTFPTSTNLTAKQQLATTTNKALEEQFNSIYSNTQIVKRGSVFIDSKDCYYIHLYTPFTKGSRLLHKMIYYSEGYKMMCIDACSIDSYTQQTTPEFAVMVGSFKFLNLKNK